MQGAVCLDGSAPGYYIRQGVLWVQARAGGFYILKVEDGVETRETASIAATLL